ncbi:hypothetical protein IIA16_00850, partial [bacterium]|nr:hypothetical protein [bacterium]
MSQLQRRKLRLQSWALAGLLLAVSCGGDARGATLAPTGPLVPAAWPAANPYPEASARRQARLAELRDPANDEVASLALRYLEDVTPSVYLGARVASVSLAAFKAGDVEGALALVAAASARDSHWWSPFADMARVADSPASLTALLAFLHDLPPVARPEAQGAIGSLLDSRALELAGRLAALDGLVLALRGEDHALGLMLAMALAYERRGEMEQARHFGRLAADEFAVLVKERPEGLLRAGDEGRETVLMLFRLGLAAEGEQALAAVRAFALREKKGPRTLVFWWEGGPGARREAYRVLLELHAAGGLEREGRSLLEAAAFCQEGWDGFTCRAALRLGIMEEEFRQDHRLALTRGRALRGDLRGAKRALQRLTGVHRRVGAFALAVAQMQAGGGEAEEGLQRVLALAQDGEEPESKENSWGWRLGISRREMMLGLLDAGLTEAAILVAQTVDEPDKASSYGWLVVSLLLDNKDYAQAYSSLAQMAGERAMPRAVHSVAAAMRSHPSDWEVAEIEALGRLAADLAPGDERTFSAIYLGIALARKGLLDEAKVVLAEIQAAGGEAIGENSYLQGSLADLLALVGEEEEATDMLLALAEPDATNPQLPAAQYFDLASALMRTGMAPNAKARGRLGELAAAPQQRCGSWERLDPQLEALRLCDLGRGDDYWFATPEARFVSPDLLAVAPVGGGLAIWDVSGPPSVARAFPPLGAISALAVHPESGRLAVGNADGMFAIGDLASGGWLTVEALDMEVQELQFAANGLLAIAHEGGVASIVRPGELAVEPLMAGLSWRDEGMSVLAISPDGGTVYAARRGWWLHAVDVAPDPRHRARRVRTGSFIGIAVFPQGDMLLSADSNSDLVLWDTDTLVAYRTFDHGKRVSNMAVNPVGQMFATIAGNELQLWRTDGSEPFFKISPAGSHLGAALAFSPDGSMVASGGFRVVKLWKRVLSPKKFELGVGSEITAVAVSADGKWAALAAADKTIRLWNLVDGKPGKRLAGHTDRITGLAFWPRSEEQSQVNGQVASTLTGVQTAVTNLANATKARADFDAHPDKKLDAEQLKAKQEQLA